MSELSNAGDNVPRQELSEEAQTTREGAAEGSSDCGRVSNGHPSDRVRAAFASAIESLKADMGADGANETEIASSLKSKIREILNEEISKKQQASSVFTAASALTSLCDMSDHSIAEENEEASKERKEDSNKGEDCEAKEDKKASSSNRDDIPMSFPQKLMEILDDSNNEHIITWLPHGKAFIIYQKKKFGTEILTKYFKESKYTSFTRKLNRWGFVRVTKGPEIGAYYHKCFQQKNYLLCMQMSCQSSNKVAPRNERVSQGQSESNPMGGQMFSQGNIAPHSMPQMALQSQVAGMHGAMGAGQMQSPHPHQVDLLAQQIKFMNLQRQANANSVGAMPGGGPQYSSAVVGAAVDALQRSYEANQNACGGHKQKPALGPSHVMQQHIERYQRGGIMHPGLYAAIMQQQAAAAAMVRAQQMRHQTQDDSARKQRQSVARRAHAA